MAWTWKAGDRAVCIDDKRYSGSDKGAWPLAKGEVYEVCRIEVQTGIGFNGEVMSEVCLVLKDVAGITTLGNRPTDMGFCAARFRPVRTTSISSLKAHLNTLPVRIKTEA